MTAEPLLPTAHDAKRDQNKAHPFHRGVLPRRFVALLVDLAIVTASQWFVDQVYGVLNPAPSLGPLAYFGGGIVLQVPAQPNVWWPWLALVVVVYFAAFEGLFGATPGKALLGLVVVNTRGERAGWRGMLLRNLLRPVDALPLFNLIGAAFIWTSALAQRAGDHIGGTMVVRAREADSAARARPGAWWRVGVVILGLAVVLVASGAFYRYERPPLVIQGVVNGIEMPLLDANGQLVEANGCGTWRPGADGTWNTPRNVTQATVGAPQAQGDRIILYPIQYRVATDAQLYQGTITLHWMGYFGGGWEVAQGHTECSS